MDALIEKLRELNERMKENRESIKDIQIEISRTNTAIVVESMRRAKG